MNVLMTGATGFLGRCLVLRLQREGHRVTAWVRSPEAARDRLGADVELVAGAPTESLALQRAVQAADAIINLAGAPIVGGPLRGRWTRARKRILRDSRVGITDTLVNAINAASRPPRVLISASAVGYYGADRREPVDETSTAGTDFVATLCADWEAAAERARRSGVRVVTLRTGIVLGAGGGALARMIPIVRARLGGRLGSGTQPVPWIHVDDWLELVLCALDDHRISGPLNVVAPHPETNAELTRLLGRSLDRRPWLPVPGLALKVGLGRAAAVLLGGQRVRPTSATAIGYRFRFPRLGPALSNIVGQLQGGAVSRASAQPASPYLAARGGARYQLHYTTLIDAPLDEVFAFFSRAENLGLMSPADVDFHIETPRPISMHVGTAIDYTIKLGPKRVKWRTEIERWEPGHSFVDVQTRGPYRTWWHEHRFTARGEQTLMEDHVLYSPPLWLLGRIANRLFVSDKLRSIFAYRSRAISMRFGRSAGRRVTTRLDRRLS